MSKDLKFVRPDSLPFANCSFQASGWFWKMTFREWAIAELNVVDTVAIDNTYVAMTNNPEVVKIVGQTFSADRKTVTIKIFGMKPGAAYVYLHAPADTNMFAPASGAQMQVVVTERRAPAVDKVSPTTLKGLTFASNAPDTLTFEMSVTQMFSGPDAKSLFNLVPGNADHIAVSSHGIMFGEPQNAQGEATDKYMCLFVGGASSPSLRISLDNVVEVFAPLKGKVSGNCIIWLGGCNIGANRELCRKAVEASGCRVVAATRSLINRKMGKFQVDLLDNLSSPVLYVPQIEKPVKMAELCENQGTLKFSVPI
jgi:hypothetical protein